MQVILRALFYLGPTFAFVGSMVMQYMLGFHPCSWCIMQRLAAMGAAITCLVMAFLNKSAYPFQLARFIGGTFITAGLAAASFQTYKFYSPDANTCGDVLNAKLSFFVMDYPSLEWLVEPTALCSDANKLIGGLPLSLWSAMYFAVLLYVIISQEKTGWVK